VRFLFLFFDPSTDCYLSPAPSQDTYGDDACGSKAAANGSDPGNGNAAKTVDSASSPQKVETDGDDEIVSPTTGISAAVSILSS